MADDKTTHSAASFGSGYVDNTALGAQTLDQISAAQKALSGMSVSTSTLESASDFLAKRISAGPLTAIDISIAQADAKAREKKLEEERAEQEEKRRNEEERLLAAKKETARQSLKTQAEKMDKAVEIVPRALDMKKMSSWRETRHQPARDDAQTLKNKSTTPAPGPH